MSRHEAVPESGWKGQEGGVPGGRARAARGTARGTVGGAHLVALIKPQFEVGRGKVGKGGIVRDPAQHQAVCRRIEKWISDQGGWRVLGVTESPLTGAGGNKEFLIAAVLEE